MSCSECSELRRSAATKASFVSGVASYPSIKELAYMVNLEYYVQMGFGCIHVIPENAKARIKVKEMTRFLDDKKWQLGTRSSYEGFHCTTFLNHPEKKIVIVHRGTENLQQVKTDFMLAINQVSQSDVAKADWHTTQSLINNALKQQSNKFVKNDYSVTITGHSLGGWLAQICTLIAKNPELYPVGTRGVFSFPNGQSIDMSQFFDLHCVAFDSPGACSVLSKMENSTALLSGKKSDVEKAFNSLDITAYLSNSNLVNRCGKHVGITKLIDVMSDATFYEKYFTPCASHSMEKILNYFIQNE